MSKENGNVGCGMWDVRCENWLPLQSSPFSLIGSHFSVLTSPFSLLRSHFSVLRSHFSVLTSRFSVLTSSFSLLRSHFFVLTSKSAALLVVTIQTPAKTSRAATTLVNVRRSLPDAIATAMAISGCR